MISHDTVNGRCNNEWQQLSVLRRLRCSCRGSDDYVRRCVTHIWKHVELHARKSPVAWLPERLLRGAHRSLGCGRHGHHAGDSSGKRTRRGRRCPGAFPCRTAWNALSTPWSASMPPCRPGALLDATWCFHVALERFLVNLELSSAPWSTLSTQWFAPGQPVRLGALIYALETLCCGPGAIPCRIGALCRRQKCCLLSSDHFLYILEHSYTSLSTPLRPWAPNRELGVLSVYLRALLCHSGTAPSPSPGALPCRDSELVHCIAGGQRHPGRPVHHAAVTDQRAARLLAVRQCPLRPVAVHRRQRRNSMDKGVLQSEAAL